MERNRDMWYNHSQVNSSLISVMGQKGMTQ
jgi:hypothetical protein